ncbi:ABC transporter permease subunit [Streptomyces formicae]|uniref:ABC transporter permease subunit n=1 Tax=Streptomyces formicae TaxID=1616117 RepID=A0ABY3WJ41_9ACTN|nr:ABC transporter permease subunit [Streptomyces formicae]UNM11362.1 ABC transporter permease subunit [Streptomyces formicae]
MTAPAPYQQPGAAYASPIPVRRANLGDALASEWTKIRSVRSTMWTLGIMIVLMLGIGSTVALLVANSGVNTEGDSALTLGFFGVLLGSICVITLGVLTIASEYGTGMIRTTLTACPDRTRVLTAKAAVFFLLVFTITTVTATLVAAFQTAIVNAAPASGSEWLRATVGVGLFMALLGLLALAVGAMIRHSAGAITIMIGLMLLPLVSAMFMFSPSLADLQQTLLEYAIPSQLIALYGESAAGGSGPAGWEPLLIMLGVAVVALGGAYVTLERRDA